MFVPGAPTKNIRRSKEGIVDKRQVHDDGSMQLSASQLGDTAAALFRGFQIAAASGTHIGMLDPVTSTPSAEGNAQEGGGGGQSDSQSVPSSSFFSCHLTTTAAAPSAPSGSRPAGTPQRTKSQQALSPRQPKQDLKVERPSPVNAESGAAGARGAGSGSKGARAGRPAPQRVAAAGSAGGVGPKGRPKRNVLGDAEKIRMEFLEAQPDSAQFFGIGLKATVQWLQRLV